MDVKVIQEKEQIRKARVKESMVDEKNQEKKMRIESRQKKTA